MSWTSQERSVAASLLLDDAERLAGIRRDALPAATVSDVAERALSEFGGLEGLQAASAAASSALVDLLKQLLVVGETFLFRQPEHFEWIAQRAADLASGGASLLRGLSAGCSTGEEAYSLAAACLGAVEGFAHVRIEVVGTDVSRTRLEQARRAQYRRWSVRGPLPPRPLFDPQSLEGSVTIAPAVQACVRFVEHDLTTPFPRELGVFDFVLCRNVLIYFSAGAARAAVKHLRQALAPGGALMFAPVDLHVEAEGLRPIAPAALQIYGTEQDRVVSARPARSQPAVIDAAQGTQPSPAAPVAPDPTEQAVALHVTALQLVESQKEAAAGRLLAELSRRHPGYLPGILELALWKARRGERQSADELMRVVIQQASRQQPNDPVPGPETLPASYYVASAAAFLGDGAKGSAR